MHHNGEILTTCRCQRANRSYLHFTALHQLDEVGKKDVSVPLTETLSVVGHLEGRHTEGFLKCNYQRGRVEAVRKTPANWTTPA